MMQFPQGKAEVSVLERVTEAGVGNQYFVRMPDGALIDCGWSREAQVRALSLEAVLNFVLERAHCDRDAFDPMFTLTDTLERIRVQLALPVAEPPSAPGVSS